MDAKNKGFYQKMDFDRINLSNIQKKRAFMLPYSHTDPILVRSTGIEDVRRYEKSLDFQGFFAIERQYGRQKNSQHID